MIKKQNFSLINLLLTAVILLSVFVCSVGVGNSWFITSHKKGIQIVMNLGAMNMDLYQKVGTSERLLNQTSENVGAETPSYITLENNEILPDVYNEMVLILQNDDAGAGTYLRYKFELVAMGVKFDATQQKYVKNEMLIPLELDLGDGFVQVGDYCYYGTAENGNLTDSTLFEKTSEQLARITLIKGFRMPYSSFELLEGSETVKMVLTIEGSSVKF